MTLRTVEGRTTRQRRDWARAIRSEVPRESLAGVADRDGRRDPVAILEAQAQGRVPELVPLRYARMLASPFAFLRGSAAVMAADLAQAPSSGIGVQLCGDAHLANFGVFATPERNLAFDLNDFDETYAGPFEWDVKRLAASVVVAGRDHGYPDTVIVDALRTALDSYRRGIADAAEMTILEAWYHRLDLASIFAVFEAETRRPGQRRLLEREQRRVARNAARRTSIGSLSRLAEPGLEGTWRLREAPPLITRFALDEQVAGRVHALFEQYADSLRSEAHVLLTSYRPVDLARKVVGVGSVGTETFVFLLQSSRRRDVLFLQLKEAKPSVLAAFVDGPAVVGTRPIAHDGQRVVVGQRLMQAASDQFLGWASGGRSGDQHFYLRQLRDMKMSADLTVMAPRSFVAYAGLCARALAFAHGRSGSAVAISGYVGSGSAFLRAIEAYAQAYADRTVEDHAALAAAAADGRIKLADESVTATPEGGR